MTLFISIARKPKLVLLDLSRCYNADAVATSEKVAADALRADLAAVPNAILAYPVTGAGFDGDDHYFAYVLVGSSVNPPVTQNIPLPEPIGFVLLCQQAAQNLYREEAGEPLLAAEAQSTKAQTDYASAKSARDTAARALLTNADDLTRALTDGPSAFARRDALILESVNLGQAQLAAEHKLQCCLREVQAADHAIFSIQSAHKSIHYVSQMASQALQVTLSELVEKAVAPLRKSNAFEEPYNSRRKRRLTWEDR